MLTDRAGKIVRANPAAARLLNLPHRSLVGRLLTSHVAQDDRRGFRRNLIRAGEGDVRFSLDLLPRDLPPVRVRARVAPADGVLAWVLRGQTAPGGFAASQLGQVFEGIRDGVIVVDEDLNVRFANRSAQRIFGVDELVAGEPIPDPWPTSLRRLVAELLAHDAYSAEALIEPDEHTVVSVKAHQSGEGAVVVLSDVSVEERRERAEREFIANAAHELQSPLTGISTAVEVLLAGAHRGEETRLKFLEHIAESNERLSRLLRSLFLLAEAQSGGPAVERERFELRALLQELVDRTADGDRRADILCPAGLEVVTNRPLLEHALHNLLANAMRHGGGSTVLVSARSGAHGTVLIDVVDRGPGLPAAEREQAFDRFYQVQPRDNQGFGLGLSIVREVARAIDAEIELRPTRPSGLTARLTLGVQE